MRLAEVMDEIAFRLRSITMFREVVAWPKGSVTPPAAIVAYPVSYNPHATYARGATEMKLPVFAVVAKVSERTARDAMSQLVDGPNSVITVLESGTYTAFDTITVSNVDFDTVSIAGTDYITAVFDCDIVGSGA